MRILEGARGPKRFWQTVIAAIIYFFALGWRFMNNICVEIEMTVFDLHQAVDYDSGLTHIFSAN